MCHYAYNYSFFSLTTIIVTDASDLFIAAIIGGYGKMPNADTCPAEANPNSV